ncbi:MAG TPA: gamma-glutamyltransferase [Polyangiaceae bacterium]
MTPRARPVFVALALVLGCTSRPPASVEAAPPNAATSPAKPAPLGSSSVASAGSAAVGPARNASTPADPPRRLAGGGARSVSGTKGVVTSAEGNATQAGIEVLEAGGNAADAAVAVAAALAVTHPNAGNLGGGGFALVRRPGGPTVAIDFRETAPHSLTRPEFDAMIRAGAHGPVAVGVPGSPSGLGLIHSEFGRLPLARDLARAIALARDGHALGKRQAELLSRAWPVLGQNPAARAIFGERGGPLAPGARIVQADLAATLERLARFGPADFYRGETARALVQATGGRIAERDLAEYRPMIRRVLEFDYRGFEMQTMPPPSTGGATLAGTLLALEHLSPNAPASGSVSDLHAFLEVSRRAQAFRRLTIVDPGPGDSEQERASLARFLDPTRLLEVPFDPNHATPSAKIHPLYADALRETEHTTHLSVVDSDGMVVALTTTISASFGARIVAPGIGIVLNNAVASFSSVGDNQPVAGRRTTSSMAPTLVLSGGKPVLVLGTPGGDTIPSTIAALVLNLVDRGMTLDDATDAPRLHHGFVPDDVRYETQRPPPPVVLAGLKKLGHRMRSSPPIQGDANCILIDGDRAFGYADPREPGGSALAVK